VQGERIPLGVFELDPDSVVPEHTHDNEQVGLVLQGSLAFRIGDERRELAPGAMYVIPANTPHDVQTGPDGAVVVDVFAPVREEWEGLERHERAPRWPD
jgi:unsaturated pyranuronate lyase